MELDTTNRKEAPSVSAVECSRRRHVTHLREERVLAEHCGFHPRMPGTTDHPTPELIHLSDEPCRFPLGLALRRSGQSSLFLLRFCSVTNCLRAVNNDLKPSN